MKRVFDAVVGTVLAVAVAPLVLALAIPTAYFLGGNPFFVQERVGKDGRLFRILKLRTLPANTPAYADKYALQQVTIPRWGQLLRSLHLDELPQLFLVPLGRMSLVGPRPEMAFLHEQMPAALAQNRVAARPGCTGLWQVSEACAGLIVETPHYDLFYLHHQNLRLDAWVLWRTACKMFRLLPEVTVDDIPHWAYRRAAVDVQHAELVQLIREGVGEAASA